MGRYAYTPEQNMWLGEHFPIMGNNDLARAFTEKFGEEMTPSAAKAGGNNRHIRKLPEVKKAAQAANNKYSQEQLDYLREIIPGRPWTEIRDLYQERYGETLTEPMIAGVKNKIGVLSGTIGGRFRKGVAPTNKGKTWDEQGIPKEVQERIKRTCFKKGELNAYNQGRLKNLLDVRRTEYGDIIYVNPRNAKYPARRWIPLGQFVWMQHHGMEWPEGHVLVYADHDCFNVDPENIFAVPKSVKLCINGGMNGNCIEYHDPATLKVAIAHAMLAIKRAEVEKNKPRRCSACGKVFRPNKDDYAGVKRCPTCRENHKYAKRKGKKDAQEC